jgi:hypothetical protein
LTNNGLWAAEPIAINPGQPYVYCREWKHTGHIYVGSCFRGLVDYAGSPGRAIEAQIRAAHAAIGAEQQWRMAILWTAPATKRRTRDVEHALIRIFRETYGDRVVNRFPILDRSNHLSWPNHNPETHVDSTENFPLGTFYKRQSSNVSGICSQCKEPWGDIAEEFWAKLVRFDGRIEWLVRPGEAGDVYQACIRRKDQLIGTIPDPSDDGDGDGGALRAG